MLIKRVSVRMLPLIAITMLVIGCAAPQNAEEFRQLTLKSPFKRSDTYEVVRTFSEVSSTLQKKAKECLAVSYDWTAEYGQYRNTRSGTTTYKPTFVANSKRAELHVQLNDSTIVVGAPPDGAYRIVLDATPTAKGRTRIDTYAFYMTKGDKLILTALRGWVTGDNLGCPDLINK